MDVIEKAKARHAELKAQIEAAEALRPEFKKLDEFLKVAEDLQRQYREGRKNAPPSPPIQVIIRPPVEDTSNMAGVVLDKFGPRLPIMDIMTRLKEAGWRGSGDERKDYKNVYTILSTKPHRFRNVGGAVFERFNKVSK